MQTPPDVPGNSTDAVACGYLVTKQVVSNDAMQRVRGHGVVVKAGKDLWPYAPWTELPNAFFVQLWEGILGMLEDYEVRYNLRQRTDWDAVWRGARADDEWRAALATFVLLTAGGQHPVTIAKTFSTRNASAQRVLSWVRKNGPKRYKRQEEDDDA